MRNCWFVSFFLEAAGFERPAERNGDIFFRETRLNLLKYNPKNYYKWNLRCKLYVAVLISSWMQNCWLVTFFLETARNLDLKGQQKEMETFFERDKVKFV